MRKFNYHNIDRMASQIKYGSTAKLRNYDDRSNDTYLHTHEVPKEPES